MAMTSSPRLSRLHLAALLCGALLFGAAAPGTAEAAEAAENHRADGAGALAIGIGIDYSSGTFDTGNRTDFIVVPVTIDYRPTERTDLELVIPYVYQSNSAATNGAVRPYGYRSQHNGAGAAATPGGPGPSGQGPSAGQQNEEGGTGPDDRDRHQSGLGDLTLTAGYRLVDEGDQLPQIRATFYVKIPTADRDKGLGSGELDAGPGLSLDKWLGVWNLFAEGSYVFQGSSDLYATKDYVSYTAGVGYQLSDKLYLALAGDGASAPVEDAPDCFEGRFQLNWRIMEKIGLEGYLAKGFTEGSPDYAVSLAVFRDF